MARWICSIRGWAGGRVHGRVGGRVGEGGPKRVTQDGKAGWSTLCGCTPTDAARDPQGGREALLQGLHCWHRLFFLRRRLGGPPGTPSGRPTGHLYS